MTTYVSQQVWNNASPEQRANLGYQLDPSIQSQANPITATGLTQQQNIASAQRYTNLSESDRQRILLEGGLAYGAPNAPQYGQIFSNLPAQPKQNTTQQGVKLPFLGG